MNFKISAILLIATCVVVERVSSSSCLGTKNLGKWVRTKEGNVPPGAVSGGIDKGRTQYICRTGGICGKIVIGSPCYYAYYKKEDYDFTYDVLTNVSGVWVPVIPPHFPCNILRTGIFQNDPLYSCRAKYKKTVTLGKLENNVCIISYGGGIQKFKKNYEVFTGVPEPVILTKGNPSILYGPNGKYFIFQVQADNEVLISFGTEEKMLFRVAIGALQNSVVSIGLADAPYEVLKHFKSVLSPTDFKSFWIRWTTNTKLEVGFEDNLDAAISYSHSAVQDISSIQLSSSFGPSEWKIPQLLSY